MAIPFSLAFFNPRHSLKKYILTVWVVQSDLPMLCDYQRADHIYLQFFVTGNGAMQFACGRRDDAFPVTFMSAATAAAQYEVSGPAVVVGCSLTALGWVALARSDASVCADRLTDASLLLGAEIIALSIEMQRLLNADADKQQFADILEDYLEAKMQDVPKRNADIIAATYQWFDSDLSLHVDDLYQKLPVSQRQANRLIKRFFGVSPQILARRVRASRAAALLVSPTYNREDLRAVTGLFYDQAHMIREIRHFTGKTPGGLGHLEPGLFKASLDRSALLDMGVDIEELADRSFNPSKDDE